MFRICVRHREREWRNDFVVVIRFRWLIIVCTKIMIVESCLIHYSDKYYMAVNKLTIKQNGHGSSNENRTDDDYGGGGNEENFEIST